jgi:hypothetical protein
MRGGMDNLTVSGKNEVVLARMLPVLFPVRAYSCTYGKGIFITGTLCYVDCAEGPPVLLYYNIKRKCRAINSLNIKVLSAVSGQGDGLKGSREGAQLTNDAAIEKLQVLS